MSFTLHVRFTGLCLFVPDRKQNLLQVLMPAAHHHPDGGMPASPDADAATGSDPAHADHGQHAGGPKEGHTGTQHGQGHGHASDRGKGKGKGPGLGHGNTHGQEPDTGNEHGGGQSGARDNGAHHSVEPHVVMVAYDAGYETAEGKAFGSLVYRAMEELQLDLTGLTRERLDFGLPKDVANITRNGNGGVVRPELLGDAPGAEVSSRVRLSGGRFTATNPGACWRYGNGAQRLTNSATWSFQVEGDALDPRALAPLRGGHPRGELPKLRPIDGEIVLEVFNLPPRDLPPYAEPGKRPEPDSSPDHFVAYFPLFKSAERPDMPRYAPDACAGAEFELMTEGAPGDEFHVMGGSIFTCMVAGGCPDEEGCGDDN